jgi:hypothetical protein
LHKISSSEIAGLPKIKINKNFLNARMAKTESINEELAMNVK